MEQNMKIRNIYEKMQPYVKYIAKRLLLMIPVIIIISLIIFFIIEQIPGDPLNSLLNPEELTGTAEEIAAKRAYWTEKLGLNDPFFIRYLRWWKNLLRGDFGYSTYKNQPVNDFIGRALINSFKLNLLAFFISFAISIFIGVLSAVKRNSFFDKFWTTFSVIGISIPSFFLAMVLIYFFAVKIQLFPISGMSDPLGMRMNIFYYVLPVTVIVLGSMASLIKYVRNAMLEVMKQDYIRTARAKGLKEKVVIYRHGFRNALIPVITLIGFWIPALFGGSIIIEKIFVWPGMGEMMNYAYSYRDRSLLIIVLVFYAFMTLIGNLLMDIGYAIADPRVRERGL